MIREFHQISLRGRNSFGVDQRAARLVEFETAEDLRTFFAAGIPGRWTVLAGGNNILFTEDYDGVLLTPVARQIALLSDDGDEVSLRVEAGVEWDDLVEWAVERGLWGIENLSLIPGKAGSAPVQNIGAYGCEAKDAIRRVEMYCVKTGNLLTLDAAHCGFGYRESVFKHDLKGRVIITAIEIRLSHTPRPKLGYGDVEREVEARGGATLRNIREAICSIRRAKLLDVAHTHGLAALGADGHDLGCVHSTLSLDDAALLALTAGLDVLGNHVLALNDDLVLRGADLQDLTSVALVLAADDHNVVAGFNMKIIHF